MTLFHSGCGVGTDEVDDPDARVDGEMIDTFCRLLRETRGGPLDVPLKHGAVWQPLRPVG